MTSEMCAHACTVGVSRRICAPLHRLCRQATCATAQNMTSQFLLTWSAPVLISQRTVSIQWPCCKVRPCCKQEVEQGLLFPRFRHILDASATLTAQVAERMCVEGSGTEPAAVARLQTALRTSGQPGGLSAWEAYVRTRMYSMTQARL